jgi:hypothetical protein
MKRFLLLSAAILWAGSWADSASAQPVERVQPIEHGGGDYKVGQVDPYTITPVWFPHGFVGASPPPPPAGCSFSVNPVTDGCSGAQASGTIYSANLLDTGKVSALNLVAGTGYTAGTYSWTTSGCSVQEATGTVTVGLTGIATVVAGGSGFAQYDGVVFPNGAAVIISAISGSAVSTYYATPIKQPTSNTAGTLSQSSTSGAGTGTTASFAYSNGFLSYTITNEGSGCTSSQRTISLPGGAGGGTGGQIVATIYNTSRLASTISVPGVDYPIGANASLATGNPGTATPPSCVTKTGSGSTTNWAVNSVPCTIQNMHFQGGQTLSWNNNLGAPVSGTAPCQNDANQITITNTIVETAAGNATTINGGTGAEDVCFEYVSLTDDAALGTYVGSKTGIIYDNASSGALGFLYVDCSKFYQKCIAQGASPGSVTNKYWQVKFSGFWRPAIGNGNDGHGEPIYPFAATTNLHIHYTYDHNICYMDWAGSAQPGNAIALSGCESGGTADDVTLVSPAITNSEFLLQGPYASTGNSNLNNFTESNILFIGDKAGGVVSPAGTAGPNDFDGTGSLVNFDSVGSVATDYPSATGTNMISGAGCGTLAGGNC